MFQCGTFLGLEHPSWLVVDVRLGQRLSISPVVTPLKAGRFANQRADLAKKI